MNLVEKETLQQWSEEAVRGYLDNGVPLNEGIKKIASENALNEEQVKRLVEFSNINTNLELFEKCADKRFTFEQATIAGVLNGLSDTVADNGIEIHSDYLSSPVKTSEYNSEKVASEKQTKIDLSTSDLEDLMEKISQAITELNQEKVAAELKMEDLEDDMYYEMKQQILSGNHSFKEVCACAMDTVGTPSEKKAVKEFLLKAAHKLVTHDLTVDKDEVIKLAAAAPDEYISEALDMPGTPVMIRNGNTNMYYVLDTLIKQKERIADYDKPLLHLNDNLRYVKRKLLNY